MGSYHRLQIPATSVYWDNAGAIQVISMTKDLSYFQAIEDWGRLRYWALCNSPTGGQVYAFGDMDPVTVNAGETLQLFSGDLSITIGPFFNDQES